MGDKITTVEELVSNGTENIKTHKKNFIDHELKNRKRKSMTFCQNTVANRLKFWKGKENLSRSLEIKMLEMKDISAESSPKKERRTENLVNELLKQTLNDHKLGNKSADDTISIFDEIFATNCPPSINESFESNFNLLLNEDSLMSEPESEVAEEKPREPQEAAEKKDSILDNAKEEKILSSSEPALPTTPTEPLETREIKELCDEKESGGCSEAKDDKFVSRIVDSIEKGIRD